MSREEMADAFAPGLSEEYLEWIDILESVEDYASNGESKSRPYVFIELGAGYGRWTVNAIAALRQMSKGDFRVVAVEADKQHLDWSRRHFSDNHIAPEQQTVIYGPLSGHAEMVYFMGGDSDAWYGQAIIPFSSGRIYERRFRARRRLGVTMNPPTILDRLFNRNAKKHVHKVKSVTLGEVLSKVDGIIDLIDMDIQGAEADVVASALADLSQRVKRIHIGTHSEAVEARLRDSLGTHSGWLLKHDYACLGLRDTEFGPIPFNDGVQSWINPRFLAEAGSA